MWARYGLPLALAFWASGGFVDTADAAAKQAKKTGSQVTLVGCPQRVGPGCIVMRGPNNTTYLLNSANPPVPVNILYIRARGTPVVGPNFCFAVALEGIRWTAINRRCPKV
jgi:hypothetical protein